MANSMDDMVKVLLGKHEVFRKLFQSCSEFVNLQPQEQSTAQQLFQETFPNYQDTNIQRFYCNWMHNELNKNLNPGDAVPTEPQPSEICPNTSIFDALQRKRINPQVLPHSKRRKQEKFDLSKFIRQRREDNQCFELSVNQAKHVENLMYELLSSEEKPLLDQRADVALNRIVEMCSILNRTCTYRLLELHSEKRIH